MRIVNVFLVAALALPCLARETPVMNGRLEGDLNANGHTITNLPDGFFPDAGHVRAAYRDGSTGTVQSVIDDFKDDMEYNWQFFLEGYPSSDQEKQWDRNMYGVGRYFDWRLNDNFDVAMNWILVNDVIVKDWVLGGSHSMTNALSEYGRRLDGVPGTVSNIVTKFYVESLGIESGIQSESDPVWAAEKSAYAKSSDVTPLQNSVNAMWATMYGENVWMAITNFMRQIAGTVPSLRLWEVRDGKTNMVYSSSEEIEHVVTQKMEKCVADVESRMPRKAWGSYQSTGADNPSSNSVTVINSPKIMLTGGGEWYRTIETGGGSVWVLKTSGLMTAGGDTNGYFRVVDAEGNAQIEVVKTADQIVDAVASDVDFDAAGNFTVTFNASGSSHPIVSCADDLGGVFYEEDSSGEINTLGITVTWAKNSANLWTATLHQDERAPRLFVYGKVLMQGSNLVRNAAPTSLEGGIYINNVRYRLVPYTTGGKTYLTLEAW